MAQDSPLEKDLLASSIQPCTLTLLHSMTLHREITSVQPEVFKLHFAAILDSILQLDGILSRVCIKMCLPLFIHYMYAYIFYCFVLLLQVSDLSSILLCTTFSRTPERLQT